jgi:hypothetical protein
MKSIPSKPSAADQAAVRAALDSCCKVDTSVITFFGKKQNMTNSSCASTTATTETKQIPLPAVSTRTHVATAEGHLSSSLTLSTQNKMVVEENETFC